MSGTGYSERDLERMERSADPALIPELVRTIRSQQHDLDSLRLSLDVARRDREELRVALLRAREELARLKGEG
jgi:hypothetical protein